MLNSDSTASKITNEDEKKKKKTLDPDALGVDDEEIEKHEKKLETTIEKVLEDKQEKIRLDSSELTMQMMTQLRTEFLRKYAKVKFLLVFDKSVPTSDVGYFLVNPIDNSSLLSKGFKFNFSPLRDLIFYR